MKKYIIPVAIILFILPSCNKDNMKLFNDQPMIYFQGDRDIDFSFSKYQVDTVRINIPIEIGGYPSNVARDIDLRIVKDSTSATEGTHFRILTEKIVLPADSLLVHIPIELINKDPELKKRKVRLYLKITPNDNFPSPYFNKQSLSMDISDILIKPKLWDAIYSGFFGVYSEAKHRKILEICNIPEIPDVYDGSSFNYKWDAYGRAVNNYYKEYYPQYDENNQVIEPWM